jgi:hypothetical protein
MVMANEDEKRAALRALYAQPQATEAQRQQQVPQARDLSQMRPEVIRAVSEQERKATQVVGTAWQLFNDAITRSGDPALRRAVRESSLGTLLG